MSGGAGQVLVFLLPQPSERVAHVDPDPMDLRVIGTTAMDK